MNLTQFLNATRQLESHFESAPIAVGMIGMPDFRFLAANKKYRKALEGKAVLPDFIGRTVQEVLPNANGTAVQSLREAHENSKVSRFSKIKSVGLDQGCSYWTGASFPILKEKGQTVVLGLLVEIKETLDESKSRDAQKIEDFIGVAMRGINKPGQGARALHLLIEALRGDWTASGTRLDRSA